MSVSRRSLLRAAVVMATVPALLRARAAVSLPPLLAPIYNSTTHTGYSTLTAAINDHNARGASGPSEVILVSGPNVSNGSAVYTEANYPSLQGGPLTIQSYGGMVRLTCPGDSPRNGKAILVTNYAGPYVIDGFEFSNVTVGQGNGAAVRVESVNGSVTIRNCYIHDCQDGILGGINLLGTHLTVDHCILANCGTGDGFTHNIYCSDLNTFTFTNCLSYGAHVGHLLKSRAFNNIVRNSRFYDTNDASYCLDFPNAQDVDIQNCIIVKGIKSSNDMIIHYGGEVPNPTPDWKVNIKNNVIVGNHQLQNHQNLFLWSQAVDSRGRLVPLPADFTMTGNVFFGYQALELFAGPGAANLQDARPFEDPINKFHLVAQQPAPLGYSTPIGPPLAAAPAPAPLPRTQKPVRKL